MLSKLKHLFSNYRPEFKIYRNDDMGLWVIKSPTGRIYTSELLDMAEKMVLRDSPTATFVDGDKVDANRDS